MAAFEDHLPALGEAPVQDQAWSNGEPIGSFLEEADRPELELDLPAVGHARIRRVERPVRTRRRCDDERERERTLADSLHGGRENAVRGRRTRLAVSDR